MRIAQWLVSRGKVKSVWCDGRIVLSSLFVQPPGTPEVAENFGVIPMVQRAVSSKSPWVESIGAVSRDDRTDCALSLSLSLSISSISVALFGS